MAEEDAAEVVLSAGLPKEKPDGAAEVVLLAGGFPKLKPPELLGAVA